MFPLTDHQNEIKRQVLDLLRRGEKRIVLKGAAGVGKTTLVTDLVDAIGKDRTINPGYNNGIIYITAPTNKALAVLQNKIPAKTKYEFKTIHSALKLVMKTDEKTGDRRFIQAFSKIRKEREFKECKFAVVDEGSMVNTELLAYLKDYHFPIIFVGDEYQINPVGELCTPVFNNNYPTVELTEIIRQGAGNPIIELSRDLDMIFFKEPNLVGGKGYLYDNDLGGIVESLAEVNGTDEMKYLAYTVKQNDDVNRMVREKLYGTPKKVEKGEILVFNKPMENYYTNQEVKVEQLDIITANVPIPKYSTKFDYADKPINGTDFIKMRYYRINNSFNIIHEDSEQIFKMVLQTLATNAKRYAWSWKGFHFVNDSFADVTYNHALTIHKSQGSTYKQTVVNVKNIMFNKEAEERTRLLYTAVTRASDLLILNSVE